MPNWCSNTITITGPKEDIEAFKKKAQGYHPSWNESSWKEGKKQPTKWSEPLPEIFSFHSFVPIPHEIREAGFDKAGYGWCREHWGTKWGACEPNLTLDNEQELQYYFDTAWCPPHNDFIGKVASMFPTLHFQWDYEEPGMDFAGTVIMKDGRIVDKYDKRVEHSEDDEFFAEDPIKEWDE